MEFPVPARPSGKEKLPIVFLWIAFGLQALSLLVVLLVMLLQRQLKPLLAAGVEVMAVFSVPTIPLVVALLLSVVQLIAVLAVSGGVRNGSVNIAVEIVTGILFLVISIFVSPALSMWMTTQVGMEGAASIASHTVVGSLVSIGQLILGCSAAPALFYVGIGISIGRKHTKKEQMGWVRQ